MTEHQGSTEPVEASNPLDNILIVLQEPQDLVNIAAVLRGMANMGLSRLAVVNPAEFDAWRITGIAHRTHELVDNVVQAASLDEALADAIYVVGTSARARTAQRNYTRPGPLAPALLERARRGTVAILFGREDRGLSNDDLDRCQEVIVIPTSAEYTSLNLAQAFLLIAYELYQAAEEPRPFPTGKRSLGPATHEQLEEMYRAMEGGLDRIEFFKSRKAESVMRTLRTILGRTTLDSHEARLLRGVGYEIRNYVNRHLGPQEGGTDPPLQSPADDVDPSEVE